MEPSPDYWRVLTALRGGQPDRVPLLELIVDTEIKAAYLGHPIECAADEVEFWHRAGYDCMTMYPDAPTFWFYNPIRTDTIAEDINTATGTRRWASEGKGLIQDWNDLEQYPIPTIDQLDFSNIESAIRHLPAGMGLIGAWGDIFTYTWEAMGFEHFAIALYQQPDFVAHLFQELGKLAVQVCEALLSFDMVKALWFSDDLAFRTGLLVSPVVYRRHLFPWLKQIGNLCRRAGRPYIFHSDGVLWKVMDDLVDCGFNALQPIEPLAMDIREVKRRYGNNFCLIGNIDVDILARGSVEMVRQQVRTLIREVGPGGGYCLGSGNTVPSYVCLENYCVMLEEGLRSGRYPIKV
jgi:uroporphyrinogen decarboxylase